MTITLDQALEAYDKYINSVEESNFSKAEKEDILVEIADVVNAKSPKEAVDLIIGKYYYSLLDEKGRNTALETVIQIRKHFGVASAEEDKILEEEVAKKDLYELIGSLVEKYGAKLILETVRQNAPRSI